MRVLLVIASAVALAAGGCLGASEKEVPQVEIRDDAAPPPPAADLGSAGRSMGTGATQPPFDRQSRGAASRIELAESFAASPAPRPQSPGSPAGPQARADSAPSMIIRTGRASVEVDSLETAVANVQALALQVGGYVASVQLQTGRTQLRQGTLEMKVPAHRFDEAVEGLRPLGKLQGLDVTSQDVGEEYVDVTARMANARRLEDRLVRLLATRTGKLEEVLAVESELARVRQEIERYEGRLRYLRTRVSMSTLFVGVHEAPPILASTIGRNPIVIAFQNAWRNFVGFVAMLIESLGVLVPVATIVALLVFVWRRWGPGWRWRAAE